MGPDTDDSTFAGRLRRKRLEHNLTPGQLATAVGVTEGAIRQMESGQTKSASFPVGVALALMLNCSSHWLATGRPKPWAASLPRDPNITRLLRSGSVGEAMPLVAYEGGGEPAWPTRSEFQSLRNAVLALGHKLGIAAELEGLLLQEIRATEATPPGKATRSPRESGNRKAR